ncbi:MAG: glycosyltransferase family 2 protein [Desulfohalobiaceae bacterium]|nr:glycosyltransferase family 2 protein [Desulfohalobiaceae bacterium]
MKTGFVRQHYLLKKNQLSDINQFMQKRVPASRTCVIVLNWNGWRHTLDCLDSLAELSIPPRTIIVCDNHSEDRSSQQILEWAKSRHEATSLAIFPASKGAEASHITHHVPRFVFFQHQKNYGFSGGINPGIKWAMDQGAYEFLWLLNNDTVVETQTHSALLESAHTNPEVGIWGSTICWQNNPEQVQCAGGCRYFPLTSIYRPTLEGLSRVAAQRTNRYRFDYIFGASLFIRSEVLSRVGYLNEAYFLFYEEYDFCRRAQKAGYQIEWCRKSVVLHHGSASSLDCGDSTRKDRLQIITYHENLSTLFFTKQHFPHYLLFVLLFRFWGKTFYLVKRRQFFLFPALVRAYLDFFKKFKKTV